MSLSKVSHEVLVDQTSNVNVKPDKKFKVQLLYSIIAIRSLLPIATHISVNSSEDQLKAMPYLPNEHTTITSSRRRKLN